MAETTSKKTTPGLVRCHTQFFAQGGTKAKPGESFEAKAGQLLPANAPIVKAYPQYFAPADEGE